MAMIEKMAKAAWADYVGLGSFETWRERDGWDYTEDEAPVKFQEKLSEWPENTGLYPNADAFRSAARAALSALLEPTKNMVDAPYKQEHDNYWRYAPNGHSIGAEDCFKMMIQAALSGG